MKRLDITLEAEKALIMSVSFSTLRSYIEMCNAANIVHGLFMDISLFWIFVPFYGTRRIAGGIKLDHVFKYLMNRRFEILITGK